MSNVEFEYKEEIQTIELDGEKYVIPQRTAELEKKLREHNDKVFDMTEYEGNIEILEILFGKKNVKKMFPDKENTMLDKLAKFTKCAMALFMKQYNKINAMSHDEILGMSAK